jgi:hypothetical protein
MTILQHSIAQAAAAGGYQIARSLRFNRPDSAYLNRTPASAGSRTTWTLNKWIKRSNVADLQVLFSAGTTGSDMNCYISSTSTLVWFNRITSMQGYKETTQVFRDVSGYYNFHFVWDTTNATAADRMRIYVNGVRITAFGTTTNPASSELSFWNSNVSNHIGSDVSPPIATQSVYLADTKFIDGQALEPTSFGEFDTNTGVWNPKTYAGTYGTNGFWLKLDDNSNNTAATLGKDSSGNSNNWTPNNFSVTAGVGNDSLVDTPTNYGTDTGVGGEVRGNYCTLNPLDKGGDVNAVLNGNLDATWTSNNGHSIRSTLAVSSGKWYWEFTNVNNLSCGIIKSELKIVPASGSLWPGSDGFGANGSFAYRPDNGNKTTNSTGTSYGATFTTTDVIGCALDMDNGKIYWSKNGTWQASGDPAAGTNAAYTGISGTFSPAWGYIGAGNNTLTANFGQRPFAYTAPSGFKALCTQNLPTPAIGATSSTLASKNMNVVTWTGTGATNSITGVGFQPDFVWIKRRDATGNNRLYNLISGVTKNMLSDLTDAEQTEATGLTAFGSDGFTLGSQAGHNASGGTYVAWNWKGTNTTVSNTSGTITSTVSANPTAGISVVNWTSNAVGAIETMGHGLGVTPAFVIIKNRDYVDWWLVYHKSFTNTVRHYLQLNTTGAVTTAGADYWGHTSTLLGVRQSAMAPTSGQKCIAYCFAEVAGFSKFSTYTGNGSADGPFVYCGFRPKYVMVKRDGVDNWFVHDTARNTYNVIDLRLYPNTSGVEASGVNALDILSNGFKIRTSDTSWNTSGSTVYFAAFAEAPFNYSRAR